MTRFAYTVVAEFDTAEAADAYRRWLVEGHLAAVVAAGAVEASLVELEGGRRFEVRYLFADAAAFAAYEAGPAKALRAEGAEKFPPGRGVRLSRWSGLQRARVVPGG